MRQIASGYNADIICLQEVDQKVFQHYYRNKFLEKNYKAYFHRKGNRLPEGLVCAYDTNRFSLISIKHVVLSLEIKKKEKFKQIKYILNTNRVLKEELLKQPTSLQYCVLKLKGSDYKIIAANTHLFYHSDAGSIRLLQLFIIMTILNNVIDHVSFVFVFKKLIF